MTADTWLETQCVFEDQVHLMYEELGVLLDGNLDTASMMLQHV